MSSQSTLYFRYGKALIDISSESAVLTAMEADVREFLKVVEENPLLNNMINNPVIRPKKKMDILAELFKSKISPVLFRFFELMVEKGRAEALCPALNAFLKQYEALTSIAKGQLVSAEPLNSRQLTQLEKLATKLTNKKVIFTTKTNPNLIGGFILTVEDLQIDASVAKQFANLKNQYSHITLACS